MWLLIYYVNLWFSRPFIYFLQILRFRFASGTSNLTRGTQWSASSWNRAKSRPTTPTTKRKPKRAKKSYKRSLFRQAAEITKRADLTKTWFVEVLTFFWKEFGRRRCFSFQCFRFCPKDDDTTVLKLRCVIRHLNCLVKEFIETIQ